jgi:hypothetical protein
VHADLYSRFGHAGEPSRLDHRAAFELHVDDRQSLALGQPLEQPRDVAPRLGGLRVARLEQLGRGVERIAAERRVAAPAQAVDQLVARDRMQPRR